VDGKLPTGARTMMWFVGGFIAWAMIVILVLVFLAGASDK